MMPFTNAQLQTFFEEADYIGLTRNTRLRLEEEGITGIDGMAHFGKEEIEGETSTLTATPAPRQTRPRGGDPGKARHSRALASFSLCSLYHAQRRI